ncbi:hypothetical protein CC80DRAFT_168116 [Byssothecium circinans]|uniref:Fork-head domain-containing protein n=1 Tax=Byssothecium circinans TaxID=147558 RepID=A0A6A5TJ54_9PLEO|nr:hypothetical protein CC80DRAFT_168116 [Byssothecium circinans]
MPHPHSPQQPDSAELAGGLGTVQPSKDQLRASIPLHAPTPLSTPRHCAVTAAIMAAFPEIAPARDSATSFMNLNDSNAMPWTTPQGEFANGTAADGSSFHYPLQFPPGSFDYGQNTTPYQDNYNLTYSAHLGSVPRSYTSDIDLPGLSMSNMPQSYPPDAYHIEPQSLHERMDLADSGISGQLLQLRHDEYDGFGLMMRHEEHTAYSSPYDSDITRASTPSGDHVHMGGPLDGYKMECEEGAIDKEQPYAQLIHRALMEAPGHTMILRDIYDWFTKNTDKAADKETKGWQNSIRHNLSMNGAFEKVDQPGEESRRGFMWRLTDEAVREGVKSTTRYRSKQPNKRAHRSTNPLPQRQASGAKGGQAARRAARLRRSNRMNELSTYRSDPCRSVPTGGSTNLPPKFDTDGNFSSFPSSPSCNSPVMPAVEFGYGKDDFGRYVFGSGPSSTSTSTVRASHSRAYNDSPFTQDMPLCAGDTAYLQDPAHMADPMIFANSPSPTADEPRTPEPHLGGGWGDDWMLGPGMHHGHMIVADTPYNEFPV